MNLLVEFEKRYKGDVTETMAICGVIAEKFGLDLDEVADFVYVNRYATDAELDEDELNKLAEQAEREL